MGRYVMIKDVFDIYNWKLTILYQCTCDDIDFIIEILKDIHCPKQYILQALDNLEECKLNSGLTYSNLTLKNSVIIINKTSSPEQFINTVSHEYYHFIQHFSTALHITDEEELATLNGNLNMRSYKILEKLIQKVDSE